MNEFVLDDLLAMPEPAASAQSVAVAGNEFLLDGPLFVEGRRRANSRIVDRNRLEKKRSR